MKRITLYSAVGVAVLGITLGMMALLSAQSSPQQKPSVESGYTCGVEADYRAIEEANWPTHCRDDLGFVIDWAGFDQSEIGLTQQQARDAIRAGAASWNERLGLRLYERTDYTERTKTVLKWERLAGSTLAWSHLADGTCNDNKQQRYDRRRWNAHLLTITAAHEFGHLIGLGHKNGNYLMNPSIISSLNGPTEDDVTRARGLGYAARTGPVPPPYEVDDPPPPPEDPPNTPPDASEIFVTVRGVRYKLVVADSPEPDGLRSKAKAALASVQTYVDLSQHAANLAGYYVALATGIEQGKLKFQDIKTAFVIRPFLVAGHADKWAPVFALDPEIKSATNLRTIADVLAGASADAIGEAVPPLLRIILPVILEFIKDEQIKAIFRVIIDIINQLPAEDADVGARRMHQ